jgi:Skp family chaperone for outer membrane proteins
MSQSIRELLAVWNPEHPTADSLSNRLQAITEDVPTRVKKSQTEIAALSERAAPDFKRWKADYATARDQATAAFAKLGSTQTDATAKPPEGEAQEQVLSLVRTARAEAETLPRIDSHRLTNFAETLDRAVKSIKELGEQTGSLRSSMTSADHSFGRGAADFSIASQELDAAGREVMWQPWLLLGGGAEDVGSERIDIANREIVRQYTEAAVEHQFAMKGIEDALRRDGELLNTVPGLAELLRTRLDSATAIFEAETKRMESLIIGPPSNKKPSK